MNLNINLIITRVGNEIFNNTVAGIAALGAAANVAGPRLYVASGLIESLGFKTQILGGIMTAAFGAMSGASISAAMDFESTMVKTINLAGVSEEEMKALSASVLELAVVAGVGPNKLAEALYYIESTGVKGAAAMDILTLSAKASAVGMGETSGIAKLLVAAVNVYAGTGLTAAQVSDQLTAAVREGGAEASQMASTLGRVLAPAQLLGITFADVASYVATFTRVGVSAAEAVTALRATISNLLAPQPMAAKELMKQTGMTFADLRAEIKERGLSAALIDLAQKMGGNEEAFRRILPNVRGFTGTLSVARSMAEAYAQVSDKVHNSTGELAQAFERVKQTTAQQWNELKAQVEVLAITFGNVLLPVVKDLIKGAMPLLKWLQDAVVWFGKLPSVIQYVAIAMVALAGPAVSAIGLLIGMIGKLGLIYYVMGGAATFSAQGMMTATNGSILLTKAFQLTAAAAGPVATALVYLGAVAAVGAAYAVGTVLGGALETTTQQFKDADPVIRDGVGSVGLLSGAYSLLGEGMTHVLPFFGQMWESIKHVGDFYADLAGNIVGNSKVIQVAWELVTLPLRTLITVIKEATQGLADFFSMLGKKLFAYVQPAEQAAMMTKDLAEASKLAGHAVTDWGEALVIITAAHKKQYDQEKKTNQIIKERTTLTVAVIDQILKEKKEDDELAKASKMVGFAITDLTTAHLVLARAAELSGKAAKGRAKDEAEEQRMIDANTKQFIHDVRMRTDAEKEEQRMIDENTKNFIHDVKIKVDKRNEEQKNIDANTDRFIADVKRQNKAEDEAIKKLEEKHKWMRQAAEDLKAFGSETGGFWGVIISGIGSAIDAVASFQEASEKGVSTWEKVALAVQGVIAIIKQSREEANTFVRVLNGAIAGAAIGAKTGTWQGIVIGAIVGGAIAFFSGPKWQKTSEDAAKYFGQTVSKELAKSIYATQIQFNLGTVNASLLHLTEAMKASDKTAAHFGVNMLDLAAKIKIGLVPTVLGIKELGAAFNLLFEEVSVGSNEAYVAMVQLIQRTRELGLAIPEIAAKVKEFMDAAVKGIEDLVKFPTLTGEIASAKAYIFASTFWAYVKEYGMIAAVDAMKASFDAFQEELKKSGIDPSVIAAIIDPIAAIFTLMNDEVLGPMIRGLEGARIAVDNLGKAGYMTQGAFTGLVTLVHATFDEVLARTGDANLAYAAIAPTLATIVQLHERYGLVIDAATQKLIDEAKAHGVAFPKDPMLQVISLLERIVVLLGGTIPDAADDAKTGVEGVGDAINDLPKDKTINIHVRRINEGGGGDDGSGDGTEVSLAAGGVGHYGSGTPAMLHGHEVTTPVDQVYSRMADIVAAKVASMGGGGGGEGGGGDMHFHFEIGGREFDKVVVSRMNQGFINPDSRSGIVNTRMGR